MQTDLAEGIQEWEKMKCTGLLIWFFEKKEIGHKIVFLGPVKDDKKDFIYFLHFYFFGVSYSVEMSQNKGEENKKFSWRIE